MDAVHAPHTLPSPLARAGTCPTGRPPPPAPALGETRSEQTQPRCLRSPPRAAGHAVVARQRGQRWRRDAAPLSPTGAGPARRGDSGCTCPPPRPQTQATPRVARRRGAAGTPGGGPWAGWREAGQRPRPDPRAAPRPHLLRPAQWAWAGQGPCAPRRSEVATVWEACSQSGPQPLVFAQTRPQPPRARLFARGAAMRGATRRVRPLRLWAAGLPRPLPRPRERGGGGRGARSAASQRGTRRRPRPAAGSAVDRG